jgi:hypothetical protein
MPDQGVYVQYTGGCTLSALFAGKGGSYFRHHRSCHNGRSSKPAKEKSMYDMKNLAKFGRIGELAPEAFKAFVAFDEAVVRGGVCRSSTRS